MAPNKTLFWLFLTATILILAYMSRQRNHDKAASYEFSVAVPIYGASDLYSVKDEHGFKIVKILVNDGDMVHVRLYKNLFTEGQKALGNPSSTLEA